MLREHPLIMSHTIQYLYEAIQNGYCLLPFYLVSSTFYVKRQLLLAVLYFYGRLGVTVWDSSYSGGMGHRHCEKLQFHTILLQCTCEIPDNWNEHHTQIRAYSIHVRPNIYHCGLYRCALLTGYWVWQYWKRDSHRPVSVPVRFP